MDRDGSLADKHSCLVLPGGPGSPPSVVERRSLSFLAAPVDLFSEALLSCSSPIRVARALPLRP